MTKASAELGVIGGSGLYEMEELESVEEVAIDTPFGAPSDVFRIGTLHGTRVAFLARHGVGHRIMPTEINFRANLWALKALGVTHILSASAVGSLKDGVEPLHVVIPDQFIDRTRHRVDTFFGDGIVAHVSLADPFCPDLSRLAAECLREVGGTVHEGGTYLCMEGPQFSTRAESHMYRAWGATVIGMTNLQEARLAREAEIAYATMALVTDYDCWKVDEEAVSVGTVIARLIANAALARKAVVEVARRYGELPESTAAKALDTAIITSREHIPRDAIERLGPIVARVLG